MINPLRAYEAGLLRARDDERTMDVTRVRLANGTLLRLPLARYLGPADAVDEQLLAEVGGPVLDVGCGPGRHLHALAARGVFALGVDLSPVAVELATDRGAHAVVGSIFDELPGIGAWRTALLLDGNIGIGGAPARLLERIGALLSDDGEVVVELGPPDRPSETMIMRIENEHGISNWFRWACVSVRDIGRFAATSRFGVVGRWSAQGRWFARLRPH